MPYYPIATLDELPFFGPDVIAKLKALTAGHDMFCMCSDGKATWSFSEPTSQDPILFFKMCAQKNDPQIFLIDANEKIIAEVTVPKPRPDVVIAQVDEGHELVIRPLPDLAWLKKTENFLIRAESQGYFGKKKECGVMSEYSAARSVKSGFLDYLVGRGLVTLQQKERMSDISSPLKVRVRGSTHIHVRTVEPARGINIPITAADLEVLEAYI